MSESFEKDFEKSLSDPESDFAQCERFMKQLLSAEEMLIINNEPPHWDLSPPQREVYDSPELYALGMKAYAERVIKSKQLAKYRHD